MQAPADNERQARRVRVFFRLVLGSIPKIVLHPPLHRTGKKKPHYQFDSGVFNAYAAYLAPQPGLEPGTYGLTVRPIGQL